MTVSPSRRPLVVLSASLLSCAAAPAALVFHITESATGVMVQGSGSVDTSSMVEVMTPTATPLSGGFVISYHDALSVGVGSYDFFDFVSYDGPASFGTGFEGLMATSGSGSPLGFDLWERWVALPEGYVSGTPVSGSGFYEGATLESLALTPGSFSWTLADGQTISLTIGTAIPEPSSTALLGAGAVTFLFRRRRTGSWN